MDKSIERVVRDAVDLRRVSDRLFRRALGQVTHSNVTTADQRDALRTLMPHSHPRDIQNIPLLSKIDSYAQYTGESFSFHAHIVRMHDEYKAGFDIPTWHLDDTVVAYNFARRLGIKHPRIIQGPSPLAEITFQTGSVLKPLRGSASRGCYVIRSQNEIRHVADGRFFESAREVLKHASEVMTTRSSHGSDGMWYTEELLHGQAGNDPPRDIKAHAFYGEIVLIREIERTDHSYRWAHWSAGGERVYPMKQKDRELESASFPEDALKVAQEISSRIPFPFVRIDFMKNNNELIFGEFTPRPGSFASFNGEWDTEMGKSWITAENRLTKDLIEGKGFDEFRETLKSTGIDSLPSYPS